MSAWTCRQLRQGRPKDRSTPSSNPMMEGPWCRFRREARARERHRHCCGGQLKALDLTRPIREEKREPASDIDTVVVDS